ncbi:hypothetical protein FHT77_001528 [Rhizobium sp. BK181]|nr:hypothetical protein [Rhizobium sp. BK181]MBB3315663.1 hypothetical protein [Rhizobium sp. BK181]
MFSIIDRWKATRRPRKNRNIAPSRELNRNPAFLRKSFVVLAKRGPQSAKLNADDGVERWIKIALPTQDINGDGIGFHTIGTTGELLVRDISENAPASFGGSEPLVGEQSLELCTGLWARNFVGPAFLFFSLHHCRPCYATLNAK